MTPVQAISCSGACDSVCTLQEIVEMAQRIERVAARGVKSDRDTLARALFVERPEIAVSDIAAAIEGVDHHPDHAEL